MRGHPRARFVVQAGVTGPAAVLLGAIGIFELGNVAATLLILRATDLLDPGRSTDAAAQIAIALYLLYNVAAS